ncbi:hypothetical protein MTO96_020402 [Rhipicephalus appendiculatus]
MSVVRHTLWLVVVLIFGLMIRGGSSQGIFALGVFENCSEVFMPCFVGSDMTSSCPEPCLCLTDYNNDRSASSANARICRGAGNASTGTYLKVTRLTSAREAQSQQRVDHTLPGASAQRSEPPGGQRDGQSKSSNRPTWADKLKTPDGASTPATNSPPAPDTRDQELRALRVEVFLSQPMYELPFEKSTADFEQNTEQWNNQNSTSWFAVVFCLIAVALGILTSVVLIIYYLSVDSVSVTTLEGRPGSGSPGTSGSPGSSGGGIVVPTIGESMPVTISHTPVPPTTRVAPTAAPPVPEATTPVPATATSVPVTTTSVRVTTTRVPVSTTPLLATTTHLPVTMTPLPGDYDACPGDHDASSGDYNACSGFHDASFGDYNTSPGHYDHCSGEHDECPGYYDNCAGDYDACPGDHDTRAGYHDASSGDYNACSGFHDASFGDYNASPGHYDHCSGDHDECPGYYDNCAGDYDACPGDHDASSGDYNACSGFHDASFGDYNTSPGHYDHCSGEHDECPGYYDNCAGDYDACPGDHDTRAGYHDASSGDYNACSGFHDASFGDYNASPGHYDHCSGDHDECPGYYDNCAGDYDACPGDHDTLAGYHDASSGHYNASPGHYNASSEYYDACPGFHDASSVFWFQRRLFRPRRVFPVTTTTVQETTTRVPASTTTVVVSTTRVPVTTTPVPGTASPSPGANATVCTTEQCHYLAQWLRQKLDPNADPCEDFYSYVCSTFKWAGPDALTELGSSMESMIIGAAYATRVPATGQSSHQKAAGMFQACVALAESERNETEDLLDWLVSMRLDLRNWTALNTVDAKDMMVRCSLDFGVHVIVAVKLYDEVFTGNKRAIYMTYSDSDEEWQSSLLNLPQDEYFDRYIDFLLLYGFDLPTAVNLTALSSAAAGSTAARLWLDQYEAWGQTTAPYITGAEWASAFAKHTNNTYRSGDSIMYTTQLLYIVAQLFATVDAGGIRSLIAWSLFRQLVPFTTAQALCEKLQSGRSTTWKEYVGSPGQRLDPAKIDNYYDSVPDVDTNRFFKAYRAALQASAHRSWKDQETYIFDETQFNAYYATNFNKLVISAAVLQQPFFNLDGPPALNYGGVGTIIGHEMMHGYDVTGINYGADGKPQQWITPTFLRNYTERAICLRESHEAAITTRARQAVLNETVGLGELGRFSWRRGFSRGLRFLASC